MCVDAAFASFSSAVRMTSAEVMLGCDDIIQRKAPRQTTIPSALKSFFPSFQEIFTTAVNTKARGWPR